MSSKVDFKYFSTVELEKMVRDYTGMAQGRVWMPGHLTTSDCWGMVSEAQHEIAERARLTEKTASPDAKKMQIVFLQDEEAQPYLDALYNVDGILVQGATDESITATIRKLWDFDYGEYTAGFESGTQDDMWDKGQYVLSANYDLRYISLGTLVEPHELS